jgi:hypothetical protein
MAYTSGRKSAGNLRTVEWLHSKYGRVLIIAGQRIVKALKR